MQVKDIMTRDVESIGPDTPIRQIAAKMRDRDVGVLPVVNNDKLVGVVTDRDLVIRGLAEDGAKVADKTADRLMSKNVLSCKENQTLEEVSAHMLAGNVRRLAVVDAGDRLVGMVSLGDLAKKEDRKAGEALKEIASAS